MGGVDAAEHSRLDLGTRDARRESLAGLLSIRHPDRNASVTRIAEAMGVAAQRPLAKDNLIESAARGRDAR